MKTKGDNFDIKKKAFIDAYRKSFGNITQACSLVDLSRNRYYEWLKEDAEFAQTIKEIEPNEILVDFAENALIKRINEGDTTAIIFTLKTKGKGRGYVERAEMDMTIKEDKKPKEEFLAQLESIKRSE